MKTGISPALLDHYAGGALTVCRLFRVTRRDGVVLTFTDHDRALEYPPGSGTVYPPTSAFDLTATATKADMSVDNLEATGLLHPAGVTAEDLEYGNWDGARARVLEVNWRDLSMGDSILRVGELGELQRDGAKFKCEIRGLLAKLQNNLCRTTSDSCDADLGDDRCKVDIVPMTETDVAVTAVASNREFTLGGLATPAGFSTYGKVTFKTGDNAGRSMEVKLHDTGGVIELQLDMPEPIQVGDLVDIEPGCNKLLKTGPNEYLGDCRVKFDNGINFQGLGVELPGIGKIMRVGGQ